MPIYDVQAPDGKIYSVEAPEGTSQEKIFSFVKEQMKLSNTPVLEDSSRSSSLQLQVEPPASTHNLANNISGPRGVDISSLIFVVLFGVAFTFYFERKISKTLQTKAQKIWLAIASAFFCIGFIGVLNEIIVIPLSGLPIKYQEIYRHGFFNILVFPILIALVIWYLKKNHNTSSVQVQPCETLYAQALHEIDKGRRVDGLWAKCYADASGDEKVAKANYIKFRVKQLQQESNTRKT